MPCATIFIISHSLRLGIMFQVNVWLGLIVVTVICKSVTQKPNYIGHTLQIRIVKLVAYRLQTATLQKRALYSNSSFFFSNALDEQEWKITRSPGDSLVKVSRSAKTPPLHLPCQIVKLSRYSCLHKSGVMRTDTLYLTINAAIGCKTKRTSSTVRTK